MLRSLDFDHVSGRGTRHLTFQTDIVLGVFEEREDAQRQKGLVFVAVRR